MTEGPAILGAGATWLLERWMDKLTGVLKSMTEDRPSMTWTVGEEGKLGDNALVIEQRFTSTPEPMIWIGLPESLHQELGRRVLLAAGVDTSDAEENRATCLEIIEQAIGGLASATAQQVSREIVREPSRQCAFFPNGLSVIQVVISAGDKSFAPLWLAFNPLLISWMESRPIGAVAPTAELAIPEERAPEPVASPRTFDILLDVALPVSVSFGKTELAVKDVLKLTTGSIVELNRSVSEPVDVIVNNCIIARGEVVVVEGNYGVRIINIISS